MRYTALRLLLRILVLESGRTTRGLPDGMTGQDDRQPSAPLPLRMDERAVRGPSSMGQIAI